MRHQIIFGTSVINNEPPTVKDPTVFFPGRAMTGQSGFQINEDIMSKHILLLGGSGAVAKQIRSAIRLKRLESR